MSKSKKRKNLLAEIERSIDGYQEQLSILQVQTLKLKLKQEKLQDKAVYQSIKEKIN